jgi:hypothetical protein
VAFHVTSKYPNPRNFLWTKKWNLSLDPCDFSLSSSSFQFSLSLGLLVILLFVCLPADAVVLAVGALHWRLKFS